MLVFVTYHQLLRHAVRQLPDQHLKTFDSKEFKQAPEINSK